MNKWLFYQQLLISTFSSLIPRVLSIPWVHIYTMSPCPYHESMSILLVIPWVHVYTMSPCLWQESIFIPWVHVYTMSPSVYHKSISIPVHVYTLSPCKFHESMSIPWILANNTWVNGYTMSPDVQITEEEKLDGVGPVDNRPSTD